MPDNFSRGERVYYADTDAGGVLYHASYLSFAEKVRSEWLREKAYSVRKIQEDLETIFVVRRLDIRYRSSAKLDDLIEITCRVLSVKNLYFTLEQRFLREGRLLASLTVELVSVFPVSNKPRRLPEEIHSFLEASLLETHQDGV